MPKSPNLMLSSFSMNLSSDDNIGRVFFFFHLNDHKGLKRLKEKGNSFDESKEKLRHLIFNNLCRIKGSQNEVIGNDNG